jgi:hypothetical protein
MVGLHFHNIFAKYPLLESIVAAWEMCKNAVTIKDVEHQMGFALLLKKVSLNL